jgi:CBS-domain-containing membrane protein
MVRRTVGDVMTRDVTTVRRGAPAKEAARRMLRRRVSGLPVTDAHHRLVGVISEADLLPDDRERRRLLRRRRAPRTAARVGDLMRSPAVTVGRTASVARAARLMRRRGVRRLPVVDDAGRLVGIVTRADLVRIVDRPDLALTREVRDLVVGELGTSPRLLHVLVHEGVVTLVGEVAEQWMIAAAVRLAASVDGVLAVRERLTAAVDPARLPRTADLTDW